MMFGRHDRRNYIWSQKHCGISNNIMVSHDLLLVMDKKKKHTQSLLNESVNNILRLTLVYLQQMVIKKILTMRMMSVRRNLVNTVSQKCLSKQVSKLCRPTICCYSESLHCSIFLFLDHKL